MHDTLATSGIVKVVFRIFVNHKSLMGLCQRMLFSVLLASDITTSDDTPIPLVGFGDQSYALNVTIGTPPRSSMLTVDMRTNVVVVAGEPLRGFGHLKRFNASASRTFSRGILLNASDETPNYLQGRDTVEVRFTTSSRKV